MTETTTQAVGLRAGSAGDVANLSNVLARSFESCPAWGWYLPVEAKNRVSRMQRFFAALLRDVYLRGEHECLVAADQSGAALVDPPGAWKMSAVENLRLLREMVPAFRRYVARPIRGFSVLDDGHPTDTHYYVSVLGVDPDARGRGIAETLLDGVLRRCDGEGTPAYLETGRPQSRDFFKRHGFAVTEELSLSGDGPLVWRMWRNPR